MTGNRDHYSRPYAFPNLHWIDHTTMTLTIDDDPKRRRATAQKRIPGKSHRSCRTINRYEMNKVIILVIPLVALNIINAYRCDIIKTSAGADTSLQIENMMSQHAPSQGSRAVSNQKENLLASLANNIELQHFRLKPIRSLVQQRPSKFDSVSEGLQDEPNEMKSLIKHEYRHQNHMMSKHRPQTTGSNEKSEDRMRQIVQMHETASAHSSFNQHNTRPTTAINTPAFDSPNLNERNSELTRLQAMVKGPSQLISRAIQNMKPISIFPRFSPTLNGTDPLMNLSSLVRSSSIFSGRANNGSNLKHSLGSNIRQDTRLPLTDPQEIGETSPQAYVLAAIESSSDNKGRQSSDDKKGTIIKKTSGSVKSPAKPSRSEIDTADSTEQRETSNLGLRNWVKKSHGKPIRNNFVQESFRDLITLSQLPILSNNPASTAPSVYEKGGKFWLDDKQDSPRGNRTRTIDDFVRFLYLLSTTSRRKRDPLEAMSPQPSNLVTTIVNQATNALRKKPLKLNERPYADQKLTHWIRGHGNPFLTKDATPRGVMWDMATDPSLAVTVFHLLERASVALPLGK